MNAWATRGQLELALTNAFSELGKEDSEHIFLTEEHFLTEENTLEKEIADIHNIEKVFLLNETKLRLQLDFIAAIATNTKEGLCLVDKEGDIIFINAVAEKMLGWTFEELRDKSFHDFLHYKHADGSEYSKKEECQCHQNLLLGLGYEGIQETFVTKNGSLVPVNFILLPVLTKGILVGGVFTFSDMTEEIEKARLLKNNSIRQEALTQLARIAMSADSIYIMMNNALAIVVRTLDVSYTAVCKYVSEKNVLRYIVGTGWRLEDEQCKEDEDIPFNYSLLTDEPQVIDPVLADPRFANLGRLHTYPVSSGITVAIRGVRNPFGILGVFTEEPRRFSEDDLQFLKAASNVLAIAIEQKRIYSQKESSIRQLWESNKALEDFAFIAAYQLQSPLSRAKTFVGFLVKDVWGKLNPENQEYLQRLGFSLERMSTLISDLLALGRITRDTGTFLPVNLSDVVDRALENLKETIQDQNASIEVGLLPKIECDASQMEQLVCNLIENSLKYVEEGTQPVIKIYAKSLLDKNMCELVFEDNGIGFRSENAERIFEMFERLQGKSASTGSGIGLAICRRIVERHGGSISATSAPGKGSIFSVKLPIKHLTPFPVGNESVPEPTGLSNEQSDWL